jgi:hypothetical protein
MQVSKAISGQITSTRNAVSKIAGKIRGFFVGQAASLATSVIIDHRLGLTGRGTGFAADILYYQRRGRVIRDYILERMQGLEEPVVAVGHSLGGIMLVDLLSQPQRPRVSLLVTAGSQSPVLYALNSLDPLILSDPSVKPFTPWLNIYNRHDFLSFCAERVFSGIPGITDEAVQPGVPFPEAHSAYWQDPKVYSLIKDRWPNH